MPDKVHNINLYKRAFIHKSYVKRPHLENISRGIQIVDKPQDCLPLKTKSNERLEFLGDGVLELITKYYLYRRFPKENEGFRGSVELAHSADSQKMDLWGGKSLNSCRKMKDFGGQWGRSTARNRRKRI